MDLRTAYAIFCVNLAWFYAYTVGCCFTYLAFDDGHVDNADFLIRFEHNVN